MNGREAEMYGGVFESVLEDAGKSIDEVRSTEGIERWLRETDPERCATLFRMADRVRQAVVGADVHLRGLIEFSNHCRRECGYCGIRHSNAKLNRYRMSREEILACARTAVRMDYGTVVLQAGEDPGFTTGWMAEIIRQIKAETPLAITLSLGERGDRELEAWREAGADRYLLRFETSRRELFERIHPPGPAGRDRLEMLSRLRDLGYEIGSGVMIGIPGQRWQDLVRDLQLFRELDLDMIGIGPYLPHPETPLGRAHGAGKAGIDTGSDAGNDACDQVQNDELTTYKVIALARLLCPGANIPSTTALATLNREQGRELGLSRGANVLMPNLTPPRYRSLYEIYPDKACLFEDAEQCHSCIRTRLRELGRGVSRGPGPSMAALARGDAGPGNHAGRSAKGGTA